VLTLAPDILLSLVFVPAGEFVMGEDAAHDAEAWDNEVPRRTVFLDAYWIGKYPVTVAQFAEFLRATTHPADQTPRQTIPAGFSSQSIDSNLGNKHDHPVTNISWREAVAFCEWASRITHRSVGLPSEAQWEKAARGPDGRVYPWGPDAPDRSRCNFGNHVGDTTPVGTYCPQGESPYHCADMVGNAWEWCADWYDRNYYKQAPLRNPPGPAEGRARVLRGGAWWDEAWVMRCAFRSWLNPDFVDVAPGFRVVVS
jgi:formylglycine-generating enzyme required for sulfatase activity